MSIIKTAGFDKGLCGWVIEFESGTVVNTQFTLCNDKLHADYGQTVLKCNDAETGKLTEEERRVLTEFMFIASPMKLMSLPNSH